MDPCFFPPTIYGLRASAWAINRRGKNLVCNLQYGPWTRLVEVYIWYCYELQNYAHIVRLTMDTNISVSMTGIIACKFQNMLFEEQKFPGSNYLQVLHTCYSTVNIHFQGIFMSKGFQFFFFTTPDYGYVIDLLCSILHTCKTILGCLMSLWH